MNFPDLKLKAKWLDRLSELSAEKRAEVLNSIYEYFIFGSVPNDPFIAFAIAPICEELKRVKERYAQKHAPEANDVDNSEPKPVPSDSEIVTEVMKPDNRHLIRDIPRMYGISDSDFYKFLPQYAAAMTDGIMCETYLSTAADRLMKQAYKAAVDIAREHLNDQDEHRYIFP